MVRCWIGVNLDIEERKQAEFCLSEAQRIMHAGSWAFNPTGFEHWSPKLFQIHGLDPRGNARQKEYLALVHSEEGVRLGDHQEMFAEGGRLEFTRRIVRPDVKIPSMRCVGVPRTHGKILKMVGWNRGRCD